MNNKAGGFIRQTQNIKLLIKVKHAVDEAFCLNILVGNTTS